MLIWMIIASYNFPQRNLTQVSDLKPTFPPVQNCDLLPFQQLCVQVLVLHKEHPLLWALVLECSILAFQLSWSSSWCNSTLLGYTQSLLHWWGTCQCFTVYCWLCPCQFREQCKFLPNQKTPFLTYSSFYLNNLYYPFYHNFSKQEINESESLASELTTAEEKENVTSGLPLSKNTPFKRPVETKLQIHSQWNFPVWLHKS